jgi:hypothetical protein
MTGNWASGWMYKMETNHQNSGQNAARNVPLGVGSKEVIKQRVSKR